MCTLEAVIRDTQGLSSSRMVVRLLDDMNKASKARYLKAYRKSDWDTVYALTEDLGGSQYWRNMVRAELADVIAEQTEG
jgi:nicotinamide mononucleotide adenylyltransferase